MLELRTSAGAFEQIEAWLRERGFFVPGGEDLVAELFLGYGLSAAIRRGTTPAPPEPCPRCRWRHAPSGPRRRRLSQPARIVRIGAWERSWTPAEYAGAVAAVRAAIERGDVYQVNLVQHLSAPFAGDPARARDPALASRGGPRRAARRATAGRSSRRRRSCSSRVAAAGCGRCRSRARCPSTRLRTSLRRRRTPPST